MGQFQSFSPNVMVNGETVLSVVDGMGIFKQRALKILAANGIDNPKPGEWYLQQNWLNAFEEIYKVLGDATLMLIGKSIPSNAKFPPEINTIQKGLSSIDTAYHMNHKGGEIGSYKYESIGERTAKMICKNPYPCEFDKGIILAVAQKFKPSDCAYVTVKHDDTQPCRKKGADSCTYIVEWQ